MALGVYSGIRVWLLFLSVSLLLFESLLHARFKFVVVVGGGNFGFAFCAFKFVKFVNVGNHNIY